MGNLAGRDGRADGLRDWRLGRAAERSRRFTADSDAGFPLLDTVMMEAELAAGRGDRRRVETLLTGTPDTPTHQWFTAQFARINAVAALWDGDAGAAATSIESALATMATQDEVPSLTEILKVAVRPYTDIAERRRATRTGDVAAAMSRATELAVDVGILVDGTYLEGADRRHGCRPSGAGRGRDRTRPGPQRPAGVGGRRGRSRRRRDDARGRLLSLSAREALLTAEDRSGRPPRSSKRSISPVASGCPADRLDRGARAPIAAVDRSLGADVTVSPADEHHDPWGLSPREREVLDLLGEGRTNRQIGETLFISEKTASVHVTHILGKLGVVEPDRGRPAGGPLPAPAR